MICQGNSQGATELGLEHKFPSSQSGVPVSVHHVKHEQLKGIEEQGHPTTKRTTASGSTDRKALEDGLAFG